MAMLHKWATGSNKKDNTKTVTGGKDGHMEASGDFANELPNSEPSEAAGQVGAASTPYTLEKAKQYSTTGRQNLGGATKTANQTTKKLDWWNIYRMWKWRKILKMRGKVGRTVAAPNTELYEA
jgi:hypothetical protein